MNFSIFEEAPPIAGEIWVPPIIEQMLERGAALCLSISGGKDSQAMLTAVTRWFRAKGFKGALVATHADLGRAEWPQTKQFVILLCDSLGIPLEIVSRTRGDLVERIEYEIERLAGSERQVWPSASARYCTSDLKRGPLQKAQRVWGELVVCAQGVRASESLARSKSYLVEVDKGITGGSKDESHDLKAMTPDDALAAKQDGQRLALNWRPIFHWTEDDVLRECGISKADMKRRQMLYKTGNHELALDGWPMHPAYVFGNSRLSCALCVLADKNDLTNGANHNPELYRHYLELERRGNATFKNGFSLLELPVEGEAAKAREKFLAEIN